MKSSRDISWTCRWRKPWLERWCPAEMIRRRGSWFLSKYWQFTKKVAVTSCSANSSRVLSMSRSTWKGVPCRLAAPKKSAFEVRWSSTSSERMKVAVPLDEDLSLGIGKHFIYLSKGRNFFWAGSVGSTLMIRLSSDWVGKSGRYWTRTNDLCDVNATL